MVSINFLERNGATHSVDACGGLTLMEIAIANGVDGIEAMCGGACSCGTCHVYIDPAFLDVTGPAAGDELIILSDSPARQENSRLSCQIRVTDALEGLTVTVAPPAQ